MIIIPFTGFRRGTHAGAIYSAMGKTPKTVEQLVRETSDVAEALNNQNPRSNVISHLRYWQRQQAYVETPEGWIINPKGIRFDPKEWKGE